MTNFFNLTAYENLTKNQIDEIISAYIPYDRERKCSGGAEYYICNDLVACYAPSGYNTYTLWM